MRRHRRPGADTERSQHDFHCQRGKNGADGCSDIEGKATRVGASERGQRMSFNKSHYTDEDGRALSTDHPQNYAIPVSEVSEKFSLLFWREGGDDFLEAWISAQWVP